MRWISDFTAEQILHHPAEDDEVINQLLNISDAYTFLTNDSHDLIFEIYQSELVFLCVSKGAVDIKNNKTDFTALDNSVVALNTFDGICTVSVRQQTKLSLIVLSGTLCDTLLSHELSQGHNIAHNISHLSQMIISSLQNKNCDISDISVIAYQFLLSFRKNASLPHDARQFSWVVEAALNIISENYAFLDGIPDLAEQIEVSTGYLSREFQKELGISPAKYLTQFRITQAKQFLLEDDVSIAVIADLCGFSNANYFAKVFKQEVGISPSDYAKTNSLKTKNSSLPRDVFAI